MPSYSKPHKVVLPSKLQSEVNADEGVSPTCTSIDTDEDADFVRFNFDAALSAAEESVVDGLYDTHVATETTVIWHASSVITDSEQSTTDTDPSWTVLGGTVTTPSFFTANVASCKGRVVGQVKSNGTGAKLRFREDDSVPSGGYDVPDTESAWVNMQWFSPDAPTEGTHSYVLEGQLPASGATQLDVRYVAVSLLEFS